MVKLVSLITIVPIHRVATLKVDGAQFSSSPEVQGYLNVLGSYLQDAAGHGTVLV
jgi:hypothetical protein